MVRLETWGFHWVLDQFCWDTYIAMDKRQTYSSVVRIITMQVLLRNVTITTMMQLSSVKVSECLPIICNLNESVSCFFQYMLYGSLLHHFMCSP